MAKSRRTHIREPKATKVRKRVLRAPAKKRARSSKVGALGERESAFGSEFKLQSTQAGKTEAQNGVAQRSPKNNGYRFDLSQVPVRTATADIKSSGAPGAEEEADRKGGDSAPARSAAPTGRTDSRTVQREDTHTTTAAIFPVRAASTPKKMVSRIPPRKDTPVMVAVFGLIVPMANVTLSIENAGGGNGEATINGANTYDVSSDMLGIVQIKGTTQTAPGKGGNLKLKATQGGATLARSNSFSVSAIPQNYSDTYHAPVTGRLRGFVVQDGWESDSGVFADLDETEISELVEYGSGSGCFAGYSGRNSGYLPGDVITKDTHSTSVATLTKPGKVSADQTCMFKDKRSGASDIPMTNSGYILERKAFRTFPIFGSVYFTLTKRGANATAKGIKSKAGKGNITKTQKV